MGANKLFSKKSEQDSSKEEQTQTVWSADSQLCRVLAVRSVLCTLHWDRSGGGRRRQHPRSPVARDDRGSPARYVCYSFLLQLSEVVLNNFFALQEGEGLRGDWGPTETLKIRAERWARGTDVTYDAAHLLNAAGVLFHGDLLGGALEAKEGLHVQAGCLFKAGPVLIFWVNLQMQQDE